MRFKYLDRPNSLEVTRALREPDARREAEQEEQATAPRWANIIPRVKNIAACRSWIGGIQRTRYFDSLCTNKAEPTRVSFDQLGLGAFKELSCPGSINRTEPLYLL